MAATKATKADASRAGARPTEDRGGARTPQKSEPPLSGARWDAVASSLSLSPRERQITELIFTDMTELAIGRALRISATTVHGYIGCLYRKLGVNSRCGLMACLFAEYLRAYCRTENGSSQCPLRNDPACPLRRAAEADRRGPRTVRSS
jgi:ATP/maltotriose-dependent transcriptional regulator MalT